MHSALVIFSIATAVLIYWECMILWNGSLARIRMTQPEKDVHTQAHARHARNLLIFTVVLTLTMVLFGRFFVEGAHQPAPDRLRLYSRYAGFTFLVLGVLCYKIRGSNKEEWKNNLHRVCGWTALIILNSLIVVGWAMYAKMH